jgi:AcrR family transcriptional regulator
VTATSTRQPRPARKTKALTIKAIESSASEVFCREGYEGASLREIANRAGVSLSLIHEYFYSKTGLYISVGRRLSARFEAQRRSLLDKVRQLHGEASLESVVYCMVAPVVLPKHDGDDPNGWGPRQIRAWYETAAYLEEDPQFRDMLRESVDFWIANIVQACPALSFPQARMAYCMIASAMASWTGANAYLNDALRVAGRAEPDAECRQIVTFISGGIRSLARG